MKKLLSLMLIIIILTCCVSCAGKNEPASPSDVYLDISEDAIATYTSSGIADVSHDGCSVEVISTVAIAYQSASGTNLYGAAEYTNTGSAPIIIPDANFTFSHADKTEEKNFVPVFAQNCIVNPGETAYAVLWVENSTFSAGDDIALSAELNVQASSSQRIGLNADDLFLADNYPGFTTLYGKLHSSDSASCSLNIVYIGFYGSNDTFLGAWYFSKNALIELGDRKAFVEHMRALPIEKLAGKCIYMKSIAFGISDF